MSYKEKISNKKFPYILNKDEYYNIHNNDELFTDLIESFSGKLCIYFGYKTFDLDKIDEYLKKAIKKAIK